MIKLWADCSKNQQLVEIIAKERKEVRPLNWGYYTERDKVMTIIRKYSCTEVMAKKVVWIVDGDDNRQREICKRLGKEFALYIPNDLN